MSPSMPDPANQTMKVDVPAERCFASGRYVVRRVLPEGGQKTVYLVHDAALDRECALALIKTDALEPEELERLRREAQAMARLDHPNIVAVYDIGEEDGRPFFVCQYITGGDLRGTLRAAGGPLPMEHTLAIAEDLCRALAHAHEHGIVHRDVKPANIWLTGEGTAKLGDFGLATAADRTRLTLTGAVVGTAAYMAPEQALGQPADARSDLYAVGCVLYEMLTGRPPFLGDDVLAVISQHVNTAPVAPSWHNPQVPKPLEALVLRLLAKSPDERPASAQNVATELRRIRDRSTVDVAPEPPRPAGGDLRGLEWGRFVGRREEMDQLKEALEEMLSGRGSLAMVVGEPGIGKTRLAEEFGVYAALRGARVLAGHCYEGESSIPYRPLVEALRPYARSRPDDEVRSQMDAGAPEIATLLSEIRQRFPDIAPAPPLEAEAERLRLFESVTQFVRNAAAASPLVLQLDDLHWADKPSLLLLQYLMRSIGGDRVLIVGAYRDVELDRTHPLAEAMATLRRTPHYRRVLLRGLPEDDVLAMISTVEGSEATSAARRALADALYRETEGNPLFIREVINSLIEDGKLFRRDGEWTSNVRSVSELGLPEGVREVIGRRLSRLSEDCNKMLTLASTMAGGFTWEELRAITRQPEEALLDLLEEALRAQLVIERRAAAGGTYDFTHALIRHTLYEELSTPRRVLLHRQIGEALEKLYTTNVDPHLAELAHHFYQAAPGGDVGKAIDYATRAGARAVQALAYEEAAAQYELALQALELKEQPDERQRYELLSALGQAYRRADVAEKAMATTERALKLAEGFGDPHLQAEAAIVYCAAVQRGPLANSGVEVPALERALAALGGEESALAARLLARSQGSSLPKFETKTRAQRLAIARHAKAMADRSGDRTAVLDALWFLYFALIGPANTVERIAVGDERLRIAEEMGDVAQIAGTLDARLMDLAELGEMDRVRREIPIVCDLAEKTRELAWTIERLWWSATLAEMEGRYAEAEQYVLQQIPIALRLQHPGFRQVWATQLYAVRRAQGRLGELEPSLHQFKEQFGDLPLVDVGLAYLYLEAGRLDDARAWFERVAAHDFADHSNLTILALSAELARRLGDPRRAALLYDALLPYVDRQIVEVGGALMLGSAAYPLGELAAAMSRWADAERHFDHALAFNERIGAWPSLARTRHEYASMHEEGPGARAGAQARVVAPR
ncbi:MAG: protein kinase [Chloroflexota bacterium]|nr:protein kinase [Chloroflexota bacterium]